MFVQLDHIYENIRFDFYYRARDGRVPRFLRAEERRANGRLHCHHNPRHLDDEEELDDQEDVDCFDRSFAGREEEGDHREEGGSIAFSERIGVTRADSLIGVTTQI